jgi:trehalose 6-phosphate synthase/phosphatase
VEKFANYIHSSLSIINSGLTNRLLAFERLLEDHPEYIECVLFVQVAVPSRSDVREYQDLKERIDKLVGMINGKFSTSQWSPIRYIYGQVNQVG